MDGLKAWWAGIIQWRAATYVVVAILLLSVMGQLATVLGDMHLPGAQSGTVSSIDSPFSSGSAAEEVRGSWAAYEDQRQVAATQATLDEADTPKERSSHVPGPVQAVPPVTIAHWWLALDVLFAVVLGAILELTRRRRHLVIEASAVPGSRRAAMAAILKYLPAVIVAYVALDVVEDLLTWVALSEPSRFDPIGLIHLVSLAKLIAFGLAALPLALAFLPDGPVHPMASPTLRTLVVVRAQIVGVAIVVVLLGVVRGDVGNQLADVVRSWRGSEHEAVAALALLAGLCAFTWLTGARLISAHQTSTGVLPYASNSTLQLNVDVAQAAPAQPAASVGDVLHHYLWPLVGSVLGGVVLALLGAPVLVVLLPVGATVVYAGLSRVVTQVWVLPGARTPLDVPNWRVLGILAFLPALALEVVWIRAETGLADWFGWTGIIGVTSVLALALYWGFLGHVVASRTDPPATWTAHPLLERVKRLTVTVVPLAIAALTLWGVVDSLDAGRRFGALAYVVVLAALLMMLLTAIIAWVDRRPPRGAFAAIGLQRVPVLTLTLLLLVVGAKLNTDPGFHRARVMEVEGTSGVPRAAESLAEAFDEWRDVQSPASDADYEPLFIVAASGGAARSAYWTMLSMECLFGGEIEGARDQRLLLPACSGIAGDGASDVMVASGISGGSVGLTMFTGHQWAHPNDVDFDEEGPFKGPELGPVAAGLTTTDLLNGLPQATDIGGWHLDDRAAILEQEWEDHLPELREPFFGSQTGDDSTNFPRLMLNSASVEDGCAFNTSVLDLAAGDVVHPDEGAEDSGTSDPDPAFIAQCRSLARFEQHIREVPGLNEGDGAVGRLAPFPAARDLADYLCQDEDLALSTAALLSARFPYVSPTGALQRCVAGGDGERAPHSPYTFLVDGGYVDSSAASQTAAVLDELVGLVRQENADRVGTGDPCIQPVVLELDNGYDDEAGASNPGAPIEAIAPLNGRSAVESGRAQTGRQLLAEHATSLLRGGRIGCDAAPADLPRYLHVYPRTHPGVQAPMGWQLSDRARADMRQVFGSPANQCVLLAARAWLEAGGDHTEPNRQCVQGLVTDSHGSVGIVGAEVKVCVGDDDTSCREAQTDPYGSFAMLVPSGVDRIQVTDGGGEPYADTLTLSPSGVTQLLLRPDQVDAMSD